MIVREFKPRDLEQLIDLWQSLRVEEDKGFEFEAYPAVSVGPEWVRSLDDFLSLGGRLLVADDGSARLGGYIKFAISFREVGEPKVAVQVQEMYTRPEEREGSAGPRLFRAAEKEVKEWNASQPPENRVTHIEIVCRPSEKQMRRWMARKGFRPYAIGLQKELT